MTREEERARAALRDDTAFYARKALKIIGPGGVKMPLVPRLGQQRLIDKLAEQRAAGRPMRAIILKARKLGFSTLAQGMLIQRTTQIANHKAMTVAHDNDTAGELFDIGHVMYVNLPGPLKPPLQSHARSKGGLKYLRFGEKSRELIEQGEMGLNSSLEIDTAREVDAGRGFTIRSLHASEVAFWPDPAKLTSLLNAVPDEPDTLVLLESTANGQNHFRQRWLDAENGDSLYAPIFAPWWEEPGYQLAFDSEEDKATFIDTIGEGAYGEDEPRLIEEFGCTPEQLRWRRFTITDKCESKVETFKQEYPASPEEAFMLSGKHVFSITLVQRVLDRVERRTDPVVPTKEHSGPELGLLQAASHKKRRVGGVEIEVPESAMWVPADATGFGRGHNFWRLWERPVNEESDANKPPDERRPLGQYIEAVDVAGAEEVATGQTAWHAIQLVNHRTLKQVAEWQGRCDDDELAEQALLAALFFNEPWLAVEITGSWGTPVARILWKRFGYRRMYMRVTPESAKEQTQDKLGWSTDRRTKPLLVAGMKELLREENDGIRSRRLAKEFTTYVKDEKGRMDPEHDAFADLLMAYLIAQQVAREKNIRPDRRPGESKVSNYGRRR